MGFVGALQSLRSFRRRLPGALAFPTGSGIAGVICIGDGAIAYDDKSLMPLAIGFGLLWVLRLLGVEQR